MGTPKSVICNALAGIVLFNAAAIQAQPCDPIETAELLAYDGAPEDRFGRFGGTAVFGDHALISTSGDDNGPNSGTVYVFRRVGEVWEQRGKLIASDGQPDDSFGAAIDISGEIAVISASQVNDNGFRSGAAYVFRFDGQSWIEEFKLYASDARENEHFGYSVAITGNLIAVGALNNYPPLYRFGAVYIFRFNENHWVEEAKLTALDGQDRDQFGEAVGLSGDTVVISNNRDQVPGEYLGSALIFRHNGTQWVEEAKIIAPDGEEGGGFGRLVDISGDVVVATAGGPASFGPRTETAHVFRRKSSEWVHEAELRPAVFIKDDRFGNAIAISGNNVLVGARTDWENGFEAGAAYFFRYDNLGWHLESKLLPKWGSKGERFGSGVALDDDTAVIGAPESEDNGWKSGSANVFDLGCPDAGCFNLGIENLVAGARATFRVSGGQPGAYVATVYGTAAGSTKVRNIAGYCATFGIKSVTRNRIIGGLNRTFDANGEAAFDLKIPDFLSGARLFFQSAQHGTCPDECTSNLIEMVVQ